MKAKATRNEDQIPTPTVFRFPTTVASKRVLGRQTVWVTLRERPPPVPPATLFAANRLKPRKRNFDTVERTGLFAKALKVGDWAEAAMMLSSTAKLQFGKVNAAGAAEGDEAKEAGLVGSYVSRGRKAEEDARAGEVRRLSIASRSKMGLESTRRHSLQLRSAVRFHFLLPALPPIFQ